MATHIYESSTSIKQFRSNLNLNDTASILQGDDDPRSVAKSAPRGSIYMRTGSSGGSVFVKLDNGSSTNWEEVGTGSSSGLNFIGNPDAEVDTTGWAAYADAAATTPVDGTSGSPTTTFTRTTSSPLNGTGSFLITKDAANRQGEGASYAFTVPSGYTKTKCRISWVHEGSAAFVFGESSDVRVYVYDVTNSTLIIPQGSVGQSLWNNKFGEAIFDATSSTSYRLIFHIATTNASAWTLKMDDVKVAPVELVSTQTVSDWVTFTPTGSWSANSTYTGAYRRVGDSLEVVSTVVTSGAPTSATLTFNLPSGFTADTTKIPSNATTGGTNLGSVTLYDASATTSGFLDAGTVVYSSTTAVQPIYNNNAGTAGAITQANPITFAANDAVAIRYIIPVSQFKTGNQVINQKTFRLAEVMSMSRVTGSDPTALGQYRSFLRGAGGSSYSETNGTPTATPSSADGFKLYAGNGYGSADTNNEPSRYDIFVGKNKYVQWQFYNSAGRTGGISTSVTLYGTQIYGTWLTYNPTTGVATATVSFASAATSANEPGLDYTGNAVADVWFDILISESPMPVLGLANEYLSATSSTKTPGASGRYLQMTGNSIDLTPGTWVLNGVGRFRASGGTALYDYLLVIWMLANGADSAVEPTNITPQAGSDRMGIGGVAATLDFSEADISAPTIRYTVATTTTVYLVPYCEMTTAANARVTTYIYAERINN